MFAIVTRYVWQRTQRHGKITAEMKYAYELKMKVRDYECDLEGIVNNANYQHYMEHTRHEFLLQAGMSWMALPSIVLLLILKK